MDDRFNTAAGWILFSGIIALGLSILSGMYFHADGHEELEAPGFVIEGGDEAGGGAAEVTMAQALNMEGVSAAAGEKIFAKCTACHTINQGGADGIGPNLYGIMGKPVGKHAAGFAYSSALSEHGGVWDWETMNEWLKSPKAFASGTKMSFAGLSKIEDRASVALYLNENGSNLAVPEYTAPVADEAAEGEPVDAEASAEAELVTEEAVEAGTAADAPPAG
ncbi:membrane c-type cytochrome cy [Altererythrobacter epoxidivorans]|uniref:Membrane c-type cytochrome cy n=1 Tax=Altererythrobacter epoxidivorans TaxID=361183 RepID=A0A0M5L4M8_9SPHN|nr:cytochrome c family protein [Altererythrobacter epoxidivorans]ALE15611.1 membrane c-type cytochrome cy [Altererythrobacter epoxidivorans]